MNKTFKYSLVGVALIASALVAKALVLTYTPLISTSPTLLSTARASAYNVILTGGPTAGIVYLWDSDNTNNTPTSAAAGAWGTNYVTAAVAKPVSYATNYVTSFVGGNGYTNWYTNAGMWTLMVTNAAATNAMSPIAAVAVGANQVASYTVDAIFARGVVATVTTTNIGIVLNYNTGQ